MFPIISLTVIPRILLRIPLTRLTVCIPSMKIRLHLWLGKDPVKVKVFFEKGDLGKCQVCRQETGTMMTSPTLAWTLSRGCLRLYLRVDCYQLSSKTHREAGTQKDGFLKRVLTGCAPHNHFRSFESQRDFTELASPLHFSKVKKLCRALKSLYLVHLNILVLL